jgi:hypothetical protein
MTRRRSSPLLCRGSCRTLSGSTRVARDLAAERVTAGVDLALRAGFEACERVAKANARCRMDQTGQRGPGLSDPGNARAAPLAGARRPTRSGRTPGRRVQRSRGRCDRCRRRGVALPRRLGRAECRGHRRRVRHHRPCPAAVALSSGQSICIVARCGAGGSVAPGGAARFLGAGLEQVSPDSEEIACRRQRRE